MSKTGGTTGTNQYRVRGVGQADTVGVVAPELPAVSQTVDSDATTQALATFAYAMADMACQATGATRTEMIIGWMTRPDCPPEVIQKLAIPSRGYNANSAVLVAAIALPHCPPEVLEYAELYRIGHGAFDVKVALLRRGGASLAQWLETYKGKSVSNKAIVATTPGCPAPIRQKAWMQLRDDKDQSLVRWFIRQVEITAEMHDQVREMSQTPYRNELAENPTCPSDILVHLLSIESDPRVREAVLANPKCPEHIRAIGALAR